MSVRDEILKKLGASFSEEGVVFDASESIKKVREQRKQELADIRAKSKPLEKLVVSECFNVERVLCESYRYKITPDFERVFGGKSPEYDAGFSNSIFLGVVPDKKDIPVRKLVFDGASSVRAGDFVRVKIPRYEEKKPSHLTYAKYEEDLVYYFDRNFQEEERAIEIEILSFGGKVLRIDRAADYEDFIKEK